MQKYKKLINQSVKLEKITGVSPPSKCPGKDEFTTVFSAISERTFALLNEALHSGGLSLAPEISPELLKKVENLIDSGLLIPTGRNRLMVPREVGFHPAGPGRRLDQISGLVHRLPPEYRGEWLGGLGFESDYEGLLSLAERVYSARLSSSAEEFLQKKLAGSPLVKTEEIFGAMVDLEKLYTSPADYEEPVRSLVMEGFLLPFWNGQNSVTYFVAAQRVHEQLNLDFSSIFDSSRQENFKPPEISSTAEGQWSRYPFRLPEQLKMLLIAADALPFRSTEDNYPHRFDIKEAARQMGWEIEHCYLLLDLLLDSKLLAPGEDRYYLTENVEDCNWENKISLEYSRLNLTGNAGTENSKRPFAADFSTGKVFSCLSSLPIDEPFEVGKYLPTEQVYTALWRQFISEICPGDDPEIVAGKLVKNALSIYYWLGAADVKSEEEKWFLKLNKYARQLPGNITDDAAEEDLPFILQEDGTIMIPLDSSLEEFRRVNPFALLTGVDRLVEYKIDKQSLVKALNDGWDVRQFRAFLAEKSPEIPPALVALFEEVGGEGEQINIRQVYHLLEFEKGATAARAMSALSNYKPFRFSEKKLLLQKKTSPATIRRNLSRAGIKLAGTGEELQGCSPLIDEW
ncbi:MAG: helicase-associated domain-containing protein [bacterium]